MEQHASAGPAGAEDRTAPPAPEDMIPAKGYTLRASWLPATLSVRIHGAAITRSSLSLRPGLGFEEWGRIGQFLTAFESISQWLLGDWLNFGKHAYGRKYSQALDESQGKTWRNYAWVASRFEPSRRRDNLPWSVHAELANIQDAEERYRLLQSAAEHNWTVRDAREAISARIEAEQADAPTTTRREAKARRRRRRGNTIGIFRSPQEIANLLTMLTFDVRRSRLRLVEAGADEWTALMAAVRDLLKEIKSAKIARANVHADREGLEFITPISGADEQPAGMAALQA